MKFFQIASIPLFAAALGAHADINLIKEIDPIPMVKIMVALPFGELGDKGKNLAYHHLAEEIFGDGTELRDKQALDDALADFAGNMRLEVGKRYSTLTISFPWLPGKDYKKLSSLFVEEFQKPPFTKKEVFKRDLGRELASFVSGLDSDSNVLRTAASRYLFTRVLEQPVLSPEDYTGATGDELKRFYSDRYLQANSMWMIYEGPEAALGFSKELVEKLFPKAVPVIPKEKPEFMESKNEVTEPRIVAGKKTVLLIDKPNLAQALTQLLITSKRPKSTLKSDLDAELAQYVLTNIGLDSYFGSEIREKRGLAYSVSGVARIQVNTENHGLSSNPMREKMDQVLEVVAKGMKDAYIDGSVFSQMSAKEFERENESFINAQIIERSTPGGRNNVRHSVIVGLSSADFFNTPAEALKADRKDVGHYIVKHTAGSVITLTLLGEAKELRPLVEKHFPGFEIKTISYKDIYKPGVY